MTDYPRFGIFNPSPCKLFIRFLICFTLNPRKYAEFDDGPEKEERELAGSIGDELKMLIVSPGVLKAVSRYPAEGLELQKEIERYLQSCLDNLKEGPFEMISHEIAC